MPGIRLAILTTDNREHQRTYQEATPRFGPAIESVLEGLSRISELEIHLIACTQRPMQAPEKLSANTWFHLLEVPKIGWLRTGYQGCVRAIRRRLRQIQPDVVHGQGTERECGLGAVFSDYPNVITLHGNMGAVAQALESRVGSFAWCAAQLERFTLPRTDGVLCNSRYTEGLVRPRNRRTWLVPNALRLPFFETPLPHPAQPPAKPVILNIGTITPYKRQLKMLELAAEMHRANLRFEMLFIGGADRRSRYGRLFLELIAAAEKEGYARHLGLLGLTELIARLDASSALVHAPSEEAFGLVVAEALARNLKFFGTRTGGIPDIAEGIDGAELFPLGDGAALAAAIGRWLRDGSPRPENAAAEMRRRYHPDVIAQRHQAIYRSLIAG